jgi:hypothetical protein
MKAKNTYTHIYAIGQHLIHNGVQVKVVRLFIADASGNRYEVQEVQNGDKVYLCWEAELNKS